MVQTEIAAKEGPGAGPAPTVSIILPSYNVAAYIADALDSVFAQTYSDYEVIVVNDGSPDTVALERVLEPYRDRILYIRQENGGVSAARNTGIRAARGRLIALLDPDDMWEPEYLAVQVAALERDPTIDILYPDGLIFGDTPEAGRKFMELCPSEGPVTLEALLTERCTVPIWVTGRREIFLRAGLFDDSTRDISEDFDMWLRILKEGGRIAYHRQVLARYRRHPASTTADPVWMWKRILYALDKTDRSASLTESERATLRRERARYQATLRFCEGKRAFFRGDIPGAIAGIQEANRFFNSGRITLVLLLLRLIPRPVMWAYDRRERFVLKARTKF